MQISLTHRQAGISLLVIATAASWLNGVLSLVSESGLERHVPVFIGALLFTGILVAYWRGFFTSIVFPVMLVAYIVLISMFGIQEPYLTQQISMAVLTPALLAAIVLDVPWILGSGIATLVLLNIRTGGTATYAGVLNIIIYMVCLGMICIIQLVAKTAFQAAVSNAKHAEDARAIAEQQGGTIQQANEELQQQADDQRRMLELINTLETPITPLANGMLFVPIMGYVDRRRADTLNQRILDVVYERRATLIVLDLSGLIDTDSSVAKLLMRTIQAVRLLGTDVMISGITVSLAQLFSEIGLPLDDVKTVATPQIALEAYLQQHSFRS